MKRNTKLMIIVGILLIIVVGASFAYYVATVGINGEGANVGGTTETLIKVEYDAGTSNLVADNLYPGVAVSKDFTVTVTPGSVQNEATYVIKFNISENTFTKCTDTNYDEITNACEKNATELQAILKDGSGNVIATKDITGVNGEVRLTLETKTVTEKTIYNYTLEILFADTNKDQNHNTNKTINGNIKVEFGTCKGADCILPNVIVNEGTPNFSQVATTDEGVYKAKDESGSDSYYFRGAVDNNYVKFAGFWWRIVRINGDGSIRLIYDGTEAHANGTNTSDSIAVASQTFNASYNNNAYVGFKYTSGQVHGLGTPSNALTQLETWYQDNLSSYASKIDTDAGFCGDRTPSTSDSTSNGSGGTGNTTTWYGAYIRLVTNKTPILTCADANDLYTISASTKGNKSLTYPIGLITADEVSMAGGVWGTNNTSYYLYNGQDYWTLSPCGYPNASVFIVSSNGNLNYWHVGGTGGVRPVINLRSDTKFTGTGTMSNPYVVVTM